MSEYLLGLDNGSTVIKAAIFDLAGNEIAVARVNVEMLSPEPGHYQRNLDDVKVGNLEVIKDVILNAGIDGSEILGVAIAGHGNGAYLIDSNGNPTFDGVSSADSRAVEIVKKWYEDGTAKAILPYTLQRLWAGQPPAIIAWLRENKPEVLEKTKWVLLAKDYIRFLLTGEIYLERTDVSGTSIYSVLEDCYNEQIFNVLGLSKYRKLFPEVKDSCESCGKITAEIANLTGLKEGTPVAGGLFDIHSAAIATGIVEATAKPKLSVIVGTWSINQYVTKSHTVGDNFFMTSLFAKPDHWLVTEASATSASNLEWFVKTFLELEKVISNYKGKSVYDICNSEVKSTSPYDTDIVFLPFLFGSNINDEMNGTFLNLRMRHKRAHVIRAIYEGIIFSHKYHIDKLFDQYPEGLEIVLAGGGANSREWVQMFADIIQVPIETTNGHELGALGAAMVAGVNVKVFKDLNQAAEKMVHVKERFKPNFEFCEIYKQKYRRYLGYIEKLSQST